MHQNFGFQSTNSRQSAFHKQEVSSTFLSEQLLQGSNSMQQRTSAVTKCGSVTIAWSVSEQKHGFILICFLGWQKWTTDKMSLDSPSGLAPENDLLSSVCRFFNKFNCNWNLNLIEHHTVMVQGLVENPEPNPCASLFLQKHFIHLLLLPTITKPLLVKRLSLFSKDKYAVSDFFSFLPTPQLTSSLLSVR